MSEILRTIEGHLTDGNLAETLGPLFCQTLHWGAPRGMMSRTLAVGSPVSKTLPIHPVAQLAGLPVFRVDWPEDRLPSVTARRAVQKALKPLHAEHLLCSVTRNGRHLALTWARQRQDGKIELRTLPYEVGSPARTTIERLAELAFSLDELAAGEPPITAVTDKLNRAFDVEAVTQQFFEDYTKVFSHLQALLYQTTSDKVWAHDYALHLLNRLLFLSFIQRKRWLGDNPNFLADFWLAYKASGQPQDTFFNRWLSVLFFEAFNNRFHGGHTQFPEAIREALALAPYLNGGLFSRNRLDDTYDPKLPDAFFALLFDRFEGTSPGFLERYNFTIAESTPLDIEVAVDPEMIGKVYESLVNLTFEGVTEEDQRGAAGIFYTQRVEIDLMCRLSLVDALANRLGEDKKPLLYDAIFAYDPVEKEAADTALAQQNLWPGLNEHLRDLTICDPACGSGSFLVGMLLVLDDLQARANAQLGNEETPYERRRRIIGEQLYGVDVMDWAVHVAELRLWLQLVVETELQLAELKFRPLLPNLSFKIRHGDSLVQEIGGTNFGVHRQHLDIPQHLKGKLTQLKGKKLRFSQGEGSLREEALKQEELLLFREILEHKRLALQNQIAALTHQIESGAKQDELPGIDSGKTQHGPDKREADRRIQREELQAELSRIEQALSALTSAAAVPFVWDIAFVEIFESESAGFDIVIGNPPYVRQEMIAPPNLDPKDFGGEHADRWKEQKKAYKAKLQESVAAAWPKFFRYRPGVERYRKLDGKADLSISFSLHGLSLLNPRGSFCFITSNSWLDVGYGADVQEFLLKHSHVKFLLDNEKKRSFAQADVNTIIALLAPPDDRRETGLDNTARFVMVKVPFEEILNADTFKTLEAATHPPVGTRGNAPLQQGRLVTEHFRLTWRFQRALLEEGLDTGEEDGGADHVSAQVSAPGRGRQPGGSLIKTARYLGNKWGGKYLRAPDIFFTILEKGKGKLVRLGDIAEVRFGIKTGANEFFYLDEEKIRTWGIEDEFLKPVIKSPRECRSIVIKPEDLKYKIFMGHKDKADLKGANALEYIQWGESQGFHERPSCRGRQRWWDVGERPKARVNVNYLVDEVIRFFVKEDGFFVSDNFQEVHSPADLFWQVGVSTNCSVFQLFANLAGRANFGGGLMKIQTYEVAALPTVNPTLLDSVSCKTALLNADRLDLQAADRRALDEVVFDVLGLTPGEREAVYEAVVELVRARLEKARSV
ncbi:Eco57I restriction-modification methylase domain-containing protein [Roseiflexus castenholzii]|uniref:Eco57I restriction-modification methylase domain-containing protein n=1 Tax=Roseiflexus castenholzii TaxID=120962 RepID=UPI003C7EA1A0